MSVFLCAEGENDGVDLGTVVSDPENPVLIATVVTNAGMNMSCILWYLGLEGGPSIADHSLYFSKFLALVMFES